jgi:predicted O-methyltransferase YrrM
MNTLSRYLLLRARLIRSALSLRTRNAIPRAELALAAAGARQITDVCADMEPFTLLEKAIDADGFHRLAGLPTFGEIDSHDFLSACPDAAAIWVAEKEVSRFVARLAYVMRAQTVIEVGCFVGVTTAHLAKALSLLDESHGCLFAVDIEPRFVNVTMKNLEQLGLCPYVSPLVGGSLDAEVLHALPRKADLIFVDSSHEYSETVQEIAVYSEMLSDRGILVLHDTVRWADMREAITECKGKFRILTLATSRGNGLSVLLREAW